MRSYLTRNVIRAMRNPMSREQFDAQVELLRAGAFSVSGQCLKCLPVQRRHRKE